MFQLVAYRTDYKSLWRALYHYYSSKISSLRELLLQLCRQSLKKDLVRWAIRWPFLRNETRGYQQIHKGIQKAQFIATALDPRTKDLDILKDDDPTKYCRKKVRERVKHELDQLEALSMTTSSNTTSILSFNTTAATISESSQLTELQSDMDLIFLMNILDEEAEEGQNIKWRPLRKKLLHIKI